MNTVKRLLASATLLFTIIIGAQAQHLTGTVTDVKTHEPLVGAVVQIDGTNLKTVTNIDGKFSFPKVKAGKVSVTSRYVGYQDKQSKDITVPAAGTDIAIMMAVDEKTLKGVTITGVQQTNTEASAVQEVKKSETIVNNVSAQEIAKTQDSNAGEVIRRIPGVSLIDNKYVMVRGLSQRYNNVWMNGGAVPSTEADTRAFSFDIIPSQQIDNLTIVKVPNAEYPADYTGGFIQVNTKEIPATNGFSIQIGSNWNTSTVFKDFSYYQGSGTDFLGFDSGKRAYSGGFDRMMNPINGDNTVDLATNGFNNDWKVRKHTPLGDLKFTVDYHHSWNLNGHKLGLVSVVNYTNEYRTYEDMENNVYGVYDYEKDQKNYLQQKVDNQYNHNVRLGAMVNLTYLSKDGNNKYQLKNIFNQLGTSRYTDRLGRDINYNYRSAEYYYRSRSTYNGQITGKHTFTGDELDWSLGYAYANRHLPDRRRYTLYEETPGQYDYAWQNGNDISREWTKLDEHIFSVAVNNKKDFTFGTFTPSLKVGAYGEYRTRQYDVRDFWYQWDPVKLALPSGFDKMEITSLLSDPANYGADKLYLYENVDWSNRYKGNNLIGAGYALAVLPFGNFNAVVGARYEHKDMELKTNSRSYEQSEQSHHYKSDDIFPTVNLLYKLNDQHQLRMAYGRSVNRPEFREVSPSSFYDFDLNATIHGNFDLKDCYVDNFDFRYEFYPSRGETITLAAFYKHFKDPIETVYTVTSEAYDYSFANAKEANNFGLELDIKKDLSFIGLRNFSLAFNGALIHSRVEFPQGSNQKNRAMQGQSPYLVNTGLFYRNEKLGLQMSLLYNRIGKRIIGVGRTVGGVTESGNNKVPDSYEMPRDAVDFALSKRFGDHWELKLNARDLLNAKITNKQFADVTYADGTKRTVEQLVKSYRPGTNIGLSVTWKL